MTKQKMILLLAGVFALAFLPCNIDAQEAPSIQAAQETSPGKLSLDIKGMDIIDVLKILAMRGNLNIVAGKNVRGKVTVFLKNVDVQDALEIILAANDLAYENRSGIIYVMTDRDYEGLYGEKSYDRKTVKILHLKYARANSVGQALAQIKSSIGKVIMDESSNTVVLMDVPESIARMEHAVKQMDLPTLTRTFVLNYAEAEDVAEKIKESLSKNVGEIKIDERMNKVVITDLPEKINYFERLIADFDERDKTVLIEAKIIQITLNDDKSYGVNWSNVFSGVDTTIASDLSVSLPSGVGAWPHTFTYDGAVKGTEHTVILKLLQRLGKTDVLSTPRITVANNQEAKVLVGTKEAYVTSTITQTDGTTTTADNVEFVDVGVSLYVTPVITEDGYINMKIKPEVSSAPTSLELTNSDGSVRTKVPIVTTSEAETQLLVRDGTTIIMAGLMKDTRKDNLEKIPLLGDIPLLGYAFRSRGKEHEKTELVVFLTPHILRDSKDSIPTEQAYLEHHEAVGKRPYRFIEKMDEDRFVEPVKKSVPAPQGYISNAAYISTKVVAPLMIYQNTNFEQYCSYLNDKIRRALLENSSGGIQSQEVLVVFRLSRDGSLREKPQVLSLVDEQTRHLIVRSLEESTPFSPFPGDYREKEEVFRLAIQFK